MIDECNVGAARHEFYRDYVVADGDSYRSIPNIEAKRI
jgi:hypothetical protein